MYLFPRLLKTETWAFGVMLDATAGTFVSDEENNKHWEWRPAIALTLNFWKYTASCHSTFYKLA